LLDRKIPPTTSMHNLQSQPDFKDPAFTPTPGSFLLQFFSK